MEEIYLEAQLLALKVEAMAMESDNQTDIQNGNTPRWGYSEFMRINQSMLDISSEAGTLAILNKNKNG